MLELLPESPSLLEVGDITSRDNFEADPRFSDPANGDFHLQTGSQAIDKGVDVGVTVDLDGAARPQGKGFDLGAFEFEEIPPDPTPDPIPTPNPTPNPNPGGSFLIYLPLVVK